MISCDFAPNEGCDDAWLSFKLIFQPWRWHNGKESDMVKKLILSQFQISNFTRLPARQEFQIYLFLTGRSALYYLLKSFDLPAGSQVLTQAFTCEAVVLPILANNFKPIYVDIETKTFSMDINDLKKKLTPQSKVLILQHTFGMSPKNRQEIIQLARDRNLLIIEDLAHGFSPDIFSLNNQSLITNNYYLLSFGRSKSFSSVFGGAIVTGNKQQAEKIAVIENNLTDLSYSHVFKLLLYKPIAMKIKITYNILLGKIIHKIVNKLGLLTQEITPQEKKGNYNLFFNKAYPNALAILLLHQLKKFDRIQKQRKIISELYNKQFKNVKTTSLLRFPLLVTNRDLLLNKLKKQNIFLGKWYDQVVAPKGLDVTRVGYRTGNCPVAEKACREIINLPTNISVREAEQVIKTLNDVTPINRLIGVN